jgi:hypothetical protein
MCKEGSQTFNKELKNIKENSLDYEDGLEKLDDLCGKFKLNIQTLQNIFNLTKRDTYVF